MSRAWKLAVLAILCACQDSTDVTQTIVLLDGESDVRDAMALIRVRADGPADDPEPDPTTEARPPKWPVKLVLAPKNDDASRRFTLQLEALDAAGDRLMTVRFASGFAANQSRYAKLVIHEDCVRAKATCDAADGCNVWALERDASELGRSASEPRVLDVTCSSSGPAEPEPSAGAGGAGGAPAPMAGMGGSRAGSGGMAGAAGMAGSGGPCAAGYVQDGTGCVDVDECSTNKPCGDHGRCQNVPGDYICQCDTGFQQRAGTCVKAGDCQTDNGGCESICDNSSGFAVCACEAGQWLAADRKSCNAFAPAERVDAGASLAPTQPQFAFDANGDGLAAWLHTRLTSSGTTEAMVWVRRYAAGQGWDGPPKRVGDPVDGTASSPRVALAANGRGLIVWTQSSGGDGDVWAAVYRDGTVGEAERIDEENTGSASDPVVQLDSNGDGFASWTQTDGSRSEVWVNRFVAGEGWEGAESIKTPPHPPGQGGGPGMNGWTMGNPGNWGNWGNWPGWETGGAFGPRLAVDTHGNASVAWTEVTVGDMGGGLSFAPWLARFEPMMERWQMPVALDPMGPAGMPDAQLFGKGETLAVWARTTAGRISIRAATQKGKGFDDSANIATVDSELTSVAPRVALSSLGQGAAIWAQYQAPDVQVWANRYDGTANTWSGAKELSSIQSTTVPLPQIAVDANGDGFGVWSEVRGNAREIKAVRLQSDAGFLGNAVLATDTTAVPPTSSPVQIAVDPKGRALAIWDSFEMGEYRTSASVFE